MIGATRFVPKTVSDLIVGDVADVYNERVTHTHGRCDSHPGNVFVEVEGFIPETGEWDGSHSDLCVEADFPYTTRERVTYRMEG